MKNLTKNDIKNLLKPRDPAAHKGTHGHALLIVGSKGLMGSAMIASQACLRSGVGLLTVDVPEQERSILQSSIPEAMISFRENNTLDFTKYSALGIGPGIGTGEESTKLLREVLDKTTIPMVLDADALNIISQNKSLLDSLAPNTIITPHPKEFDRLFGIHSNIECRIETAIKKSGELKIVIVLKGHQTCISHSGESFLNTTTGNAGLAKGGSGDALTGMICSFLAQGYDAFSAAKIAVYLHGLAADFTLESQSMESMLITDVISCLGKAFKEIYS